MTHGKSNQKKAGKGHGHLYENGAFENFGYFPHGSFYFFKEPVRKQTFLRSSGLFFKNKFYLSDNMLLFMVDIGW
jgi:hypothetical protein